jgi:hypothetical protein
MSISGTRGLVRVSKNLSCVLQAAMAVEGVREPEFYRRLIGREYPGEYGERLSARRRGNKFEANLHQNNAALLRRSVGPTFGLDPEVMVVRNFAEEVPGPPTTMRAHRLARMRRVMADLAAGKEVPDLVIQPQFALPTSPDGARFEYVSPDFAVLDPKKRIYVPGEEKSFIVRDRVVEPDDLDLTRRQAAAQILAIRAQARQMGIEKRVENRAVFVFATPYGLSPAPAVVEPLHAEVHELRRALTVYDSARKMLARLRAQGAAPLEMLADELPRNFQESCYGSCILAAECERQARHRAAVMGDDAAQLVGGEMDLRQLIRLVVRGTSDRPEDLELVGEIRRASTALGLTENELLRRLA